MTRDKRATDITEAAARTSLAVANLLRLADADLRDAAVLEAGRNAGNAPALAAQAVIRLVDAVAATEVGWGSSAVGASLDLIPGLNPLKPLLTAVTKRLPQAAAPMPAKDGQAPTAPDPEVLRDGMRQAKALLKELTIRFQVDLMGNGPAGNTAPVRAEPPPQRAKAAPPPSVTRTTPVAAGRTPRHVQTAPTVKIEAPSKADMVASRHAAAPRKEVQSSRPIEAVPDAEPRDVPGRSPLTPRPHSGSAASTAFWSLMDRWKVPDVQALDLLGHPGGLTKKGTRPRFKLVGGEVEMFQGLQEIDNALVPLKLDPCKWLHNPLRAAPFDGATPLTFLTRTRMVGVRSTIRFILQSGLAMSVST